MERAAHSARRAIAAVAATVAVLLAGLALLVWDVRSGPLAIDISVTQAVKVAMPQVLVDAFQGDRRVAAVGQISTCRGLQESAEVLNRDDQHGGVGTRGGFIRSIGERSISSSSSAHFQNC